MKILLSVLIFSIFSLASGADVNCKATGMWKSGAAQLMIDCAGVKGDISNNTVAKSITVTVKRPVMKDNKPVIEDGVPKYDEVPYTLTNLPAPAYLYYANPKHPDILSALAKIDGALTRGDKVDFNSEKIVLDDSTELFDGSIEGVLKLGTIAGLKGKSDVATIEVTCEYGIFDAEGKMSTKPKISLINAEFCTGKKICVGLATCSGEGYDKKEKVLGCAAVGDECPDATTCYNDKKVLTTSAK